MFSYICLKMSKDLSAKYYQENKEKYQKNIKISEKYQNLSKEEKDDKKRQYSHKRYKNLLEDEK